MKKYTYGQLAEEWFSQAVVAKTKSSTMTIYYTCLHKHILPMLGEKDLTSLDSEALREYFDGLTCKGVNARTGGELSNSTVSLIYSVVAATFAYAIDKFLICDNPIKRVKRPAKTYLEKRVLTRDEQSRLEKAIKYSFEYRTIGVLLSLYTGMRIGEVCALRWDDIDFVNETIIISNTVSRVKNFDEDNDAKTLTMVRSAKTKRSIRSIPIPTFLMQKLKMLRVNNFGEFVVNNRQADKPMCTRLMTYIFKRTVKLACIEDANFHCLRHTFATRALENGMDIKTTSEILGHSNYNITMNIYTHSIIEHKREMMCKVKPVNEEIQFGLEDEYLFDFKAAKKQANVLAQELAS